MGAYQMADKGLREMTVSLSARGLMELLSGIVSPQEFKQAHRWGSNMPGWNPFANCGCRGIVITEPMKHDHPDRPIVIRSTTSPG